MEMHRPEQNMEGGAKRGLPGGGRLSLGPRELQGGALRKAVPPLPEAVMGDLCGMLGERGQQSRTECADVREGQRSNRRNEPQESQTSLEVFDGYIIFRNSHPVTRARNATRAGPRATRAHPLSSPVAEVPWSSPRGSGKAGASEDGCDLSKLPHIDAW